jgi:hypothetical protein
MIVPSTYNVRRLPLQARQVAWHKGQTNNQLLQATMFFSHVAPAA